MSQHATSAQHIKRSARHQITFQSYSRDTHLSAVTCPPDISTEVSGKRIVLQLSFVLWLQSPRDHLTGNHIIWDNLNLCS